MISITSQFGAAQVHQDKVSGTGPVGTLTEASSVAGSPAGTTVQLSPLSRMLSDAALRAAGRTGIVDSNGLTASAQASIDKITGQNYASNKAAHDAEVPNSSDPQRLALARQATDAVNDKGSNPFKGISEWQLTLVIYDDSGAFTVNERRAALLEASDQVYARKRAEFGTVSEQYLRT